MSTFILIHGAFHGAWCWDRVTPLLKNAGHEVTALDLPGMGDDPTEIANASFAKSIENITSLIHKAIQPVILVGHSLGGIAITQAAETVPEKISKLVYLTAFLPKSGESCLSLAMTDSGLVPYGLEFSTDGASATMRDDWIKAAFYSDCTDADVAAAKQKLRPQPIESYIHPAMITKERAGSVSRIYIECLRDHAITPGFQRKMATENQCETVLTLDSSHSPFISAPEQLAAHLLSVS